MLILPGSRFCLLILVVCTVTFSTNVACCQSFDIHSAIASAKDGDVVRIPAGNYSGSIIINSSIEVVADGEVIIDGNGEGDVFKVIAPGVTIRGFTIRRTGISLDRENAGITVLAEGVTIENNTMEDVLFGIYLKNAPNSIIRNNVIGGKDLSIARRGDGIRLWYSANSIIENNIVKDSRDVVIWFSNDVLIKNNRVIDGRYGLHFMYSNNNILEDNHLEGNSVGAFLMYSNNLKLYRNVIIRSRGPSGYAIGLKDMDNVHAENNLFLGNRIGVYLDNSPSSVRVSNFFKRNIFASNDIGVAFQPSVKRNQFTENSFIENIQQVAVLGRGNFSGNDFSIDGRGNFWSDYRGYDLDADGLGDLPYQSQSLFEDLMNREPKLRLFIYSPAQQALDLAARAFPVVRPEPKFNDNAPLMHPVNIETNYNPESARWPMFTLACGLLTSAVVVLISGRIKLPATISISENNSGESP